MLPRPLLASRRSSAPLALHLLLASLTCLWPLLASRSLLAQGYRPILPGTPGSLAPYSRPAPTRAVESVRAGPRRAGYHPTAPPQSPVVPPSWRGRNGLPHRGDAWSQPRASTVDSFGQPQRQPGQPVIRFEEGEGFSPADEPAPEQVGAEAWRGTLPSAQELISRRYRDPAVRALLTSLSPNEALELYAQTLQLARERHLSPPPLSRTVRRGLFNLVEALRNPDFQRALNLPGPPPQAREFALALAQSIDPQAVESEAQALSVLQQAMQSAQVSLGLPPAAVALEFQYGLLESLDQFSAFLPPQSLREQSAATQGTQSGIGVQIELTPQGLRVVRLLPGSPAAAAGLAQGDILTAVDGRSLRGLDLATATALISGPEGTSVTLSVWRAGNAVAALRIPRQRLGSGTVSDARLIDPQTAYVRLELFAQASAGELERALDQLGQQGMRGLILDLRGNPGGLLSSAIEISRLFLARGTVVATRGRNSED
ncbi:MAG: S41 family peptidase, partial [Planctomycetaceae bacterium]